MTRPIVRWGLTLGLGGAAALGLPAPLSAQEPDRTRAASEAASQGGEADRLFRLGEFAAALPLYQAERASRALTGDLRYEAYASRAIGICHAELGDDSAAIASWRQAHAIDLKRDDPGFAGYDDFLTAQAEARLGRPDDAVRTLERALPRLTGAADRDHEIDALLVLTRILIDTNRADQAQPHADRALDLAQKANDPWRIGDSLAAAGQVAGARNQSEVALDRFAAAQRVFEQQGRAAEAAWMETTSASALVLLNRPDQALARFEQAVRLHKHLEDGGATSEDLAAVAGLHLAAGRVEPALAAAQEAVDQARDADDRPREVEARVRLAQVQGTKNNWGKAAETLDEAVIIGQQLARDDPAEQIRLLLTAAATDARAQLNTRADERLKTAAVLAEELKAPALQSLVAATAASLKSAQPPSAPPPPPSPAPR